MPRYLLLLRHCRATRLLFFYVHRISANQEKKDLCGPPFFSNVTNNSNVAVISMPVSSILSFCQGQIWCNHSNCGPGFFFSEITDIFCRIFTVWTQRTQLFIPYPFSPTLTLCHPLMSDVSVRQGLRENTVCVSFRTCMCVLHGCVCVCVLYLVEPALC